MAGFDASPLENFGESIKVIETSAGSGGYLSFENLTHSCKEQNRPNPVFGAVMIALVVIGLFGNCLVFFTIMILREYRKSVTNWYILQLTLADTLFLLMLPFTAQSEILGKWEFSLSLCKFKEAVIFINYYASIYFLVIMSFDRYMAVTKAFASSQWVTTLRSPAASYVISLIGWILSALLCIQLYQNSSIDDCHICLYKFFEEVKEPKVHSSGDNGISIDTLVDILDILGKTNETDTYEELNKLEQQDNSEMEYNCKLPDEEPLRIWLYGNFAGAFVLPFVLICFFYGMIMRTITSATSIGDNERQRSYRRRVTMIVLALVSLFALSWLPWYLEKLIKIRGIHLSTAHCNAFSDVVRAIAYLNSAFNPYFYSFLGFHFRERLKRASGQVRFLSSLRSRATAISSIKKKRHSSSNSAGSIRAHPNCQHHSHINKAHLLPNRPETPRGSIVQKTERTVI